MEIDTVDRATILPIVKNFGKPALLKFTQFSAVNAPVIFDR